MKHSKKMNRRILLWAVAGMMTASTPYLSSCKKKQQEMEQSPSKQELAGIAWQSDYNQAITKAKKEQKPLLLAFHAKGCLYCEKMKKETYPDATVIKAAEAFIPVMIDVDKQQKLAEQYHVESIPMYVIVNPDESTTTSKKGFMPPNEFVKMLDEAKKQ